MRIISKDKLDALAALNKGNPAAQYFANERIKSSSLVKELHSLIPADSNSVKNLPLIMEFKPDMSYFCIKNLTIKRLWKEDYDKIKTRRLFTEDNIQSQNLSVVHLNPENILKRMNFKLVNAKESTSTAPVESAMPPDTEDVL
jgi:hypothetical protein